MNPIAIIGCVVGIIGCVVGVATFTSAQITRAKQDGVQIAKLDQCVNGIEEIKESMKETNREVDKTLDIHTRQITELKAQMEIVLEKIGK